MSEGGISIVLPVHNQADHIGRLVRDYVDALLPLGRGYEVVLVPNACRDASEDVCRALANEHDTIRVVPSPGPGWGRAVRVGLGAARGDLLCYTNSARTSAAELGLLLRYALAAPGTVVKANRKIREHLRRRIGSLLYNMECRTLFDLSCWDINGTPKIFPRSCTALLGLSRDDDLIDVEFVVLCRRVGYPMLEVPIFSQRRHGGRSTTTMHSAVRMYWGAYQLWRTWR
ncbi:MAG TPA: glycosyltransferase [Candidatus Binatus sp.]|jgi:glycosyltransferase involved in cell wall biosynthesis|nr:glycosyltransferase [Candidatus Binatus sp.]